MPSKKTAKARAKRVADRVLGRKPPLDKDEMLARVPSTEWLTTPQVQKIFNDAHEVTIYRWIDQGDLKPHKTRALGRAYVYKREDVIALIEKRSEPTSVEEPTPVTKKPKK